MVKTLTWELVPWYGNPAMGMAWRAKVGRGFLWLHEFARKRNPKVWNGVTYVSSFGANSEKSFTGFLPGLTMEQAKNAVLAEAQKHW